MKKVVALKKQTAYRAAVFVICGLVFAFCYGKILDHYNPLARYPYGTQLEREIIAQSLDDEQIEELITMQLLPSEFMDFMDYSNFVITNARYYAICSDVRPSDPEVIIEFVNNYKARLSLNEMAALLRWYSYTEISQYLESGTQAVLSDNPEDPNLVLNSSVTVYTYSPLGLGMDEDGIILQKEALEAWQNMKEAAAASGIELEAAAGYVSYDDQKKDTDSVQLGSLSVLPYGSREEQLGTTVRLVQAQSWAAACRQNGNTTSCSGAEEYMEDSDLAAIDWLEEHAWEYGFVIRYPQNKETLTSHLYQPFILRYVGLETAQLLDSRDLVLEQLQN